MLIACFAQAFLFSLCDYAMRSRKLFFSKYLVYFVGKVACRTLGTDSLASFENRLIGVRQIFE